VPGKAAFPAGAAVRLHWRPENLHLFDAASGKRRDDAMTLAIDDTERLVQASLA